MSEAPWVVVGSGGVGKCTRCGETFKVELPARISVWTAAARAFVDAHRDCQEPTASGGKEDE